MQGAIKVARQGGAHLIKLVGDVRVTLCADFDDYLNRIFSEDNFRSVIIDLTEADNIDSTTLGLLARVSIESRKQHNLTPVIVSDNASINRLLDSMGFGHVFQLVDTRPETDTELSELPHVPCTEAAMRQKVIDSHRILMGLCEENKARFSELVTALEREH